MPFALLLLAVLFGAALLLASHAMETAPEDSSARIAARLVLSLFGDS